MLTMAAKTYKPSDSLRFKLLQSAPVNRDRKEKGPKKYRQYGNQLGQEDARTWGDASRSRRWSRRMLGAGAHRAPPPAPPGRGASRPETSGLSFTLKVKSNIPGAKVPETASSSRQRGKKSPCFYCCHNPEVALGKYKSAEQTSKSTI